MDKTVKSNSFTNIIIKRESVIILTLILLWALIQFVVSEHLAMRTSVDSEMYISGAKKLLNGQLPQGRDIFYSSYLIVLAFISFLGLDPESVIYVHFLTAIGAIFCSYRLVLKLTGDTISAISAPLLYITWFKFQQWNLIVYTDAMFSHMAIITIYALITARNLKQKISAIALIFFTSFLRPTGLGLLVVTSVYLVLETTFVKKIKLLPKIVAFTLFTLSALWIINTALRGFIDSFIESYKVAEIIYPKIKFVIEEPEFLDIPAKTNEPIWRLFLFIINNPIYFLKLFTVKGLLFVGHIKPYYSLPHNVIIAAFLYPLYFLAIKGYLSIKKSYPKLLLSSFIVFQTIVS